jgi:hypothetical protein
LTAFCWKKLDWWRYPNPSFGPSDLNLILWACKLGAFGQSLQLLYSIALFICVLLTSDKDSWELLHSCFTITRNCHVKLQRLEMSLESPAIIATFVQLRLYWWMKESVYRRQDALDIYWLLLAYGCLCLLLEWIWKSCGQIDEDVIQEVVRLGFDRTQLIDSLVNRLQNKVMNSCSAYLVFQQCLCSYFYWHCTIWAWQTCVSAMVPWQYVLWHHFTSGVIKGYVQGALGPNHCPLVGKLCRWLRCLLVEGPAKMKQSFPLHACCSLNKDNVDFFY